ncbi:MAG: proline dehydrogenase family protein [Deltaproteobacteria bacterium]|nr:proline dehydrogenase family protein [Deltaproteobacteria bacterium]
MSVFDKVVKYGLPLVPKVIVGAVARRYVAGNSLDDAVRAMRRLNQEGAQTTVDVLGEEVTDLGRAEVGLEHYMSLLETVEREDLDRNISVKPTSLGLKIDEAVCGDHIETVVARAAEIGGFVRIDMEDHTCTDATLRIFRRIREQYANVGVVLQSYMHRTVADINDLLPLEPKIRICKGIYREPRAVAWQDFDTVRANFMYATEKLLIGKAYVGIATHDPYLVWAGMTLIDRLGVAPDHYEFQMLLGVDPELRRIILDRGHRLRVYVPYGKDWYPYSMRRLRENPTIARHVMRAMLGGR